MHPAVINSADCSRRHLPASCAPTLVMSQVVLALLVISALEFVAAPQCRADEPTPASSALEDGQAQPLEPGVPAKPIETADERPSASRSGGQPTASRVTRREKPDPVREVIEEELADAPPDERDIWYQEMKSLPAEIVREMVRLRRQLLLQPDHDDPASAEYNTLPGVLPPDAIEQQLPQPTPEPRAAVDRTSGDPLYAALLRTRAQLTRSREISAFNLAHFETPGYRRMVVDHRWPLTRQPTTETSLSAGVRYDWITPSRVDPSEDLRDFALKRQWVIGVELPNGHVGWITSGRLIRGTNPDGAPARLSVEVQGHIWPIWPAVAYPELQDMKDQPAAKPAPTVDRTKPSADPAPPAEFIDTHGLSALPAGLGEVVGPCLLRVKLQQLPVAQPMVAEHDSTMDSALESTSSSPAAIGSVDTPALVTVFLGDPARLLPGSFPGVWELRPAATSHGEQPQPISHEQTATPARPTTIDDVPAEWRELAKRALTTSPTVRKAMSPAYGRLCDDVAAAYQIETLCDLGDAMGPLAPVLQFGVRERSNVHFDAELREFERLSEQLRRIDAVLDDRDPHP